MDLSPETLRIHTASRMPHISTRSGHLHDTSVSSEGNWPAGNNGPRNTGITTAPSSSKPSRQSPEATTDHSTLNNSETQPTTPKAGWNNNPPQGVPGSGRNNNGPPLSMITQGYYDALEPTTNSTTNWVAQQSIALSPPHSATNTPLNPSRPPLSRSSSSATAQPLIKPIRSFKPSRRSLDMASRRFSQDPDSTLRLLEGYNNLRSPGSSGQEQDNEQNSDESDLFLRAAREEEELDREAESHNGNPLNRSDSRKVRFCLSFSHLKKPYPTQDTLRNHVRALESEQPSLVNHL